MNQIMKMKYLNKWYKLTPNNNIINFHLTMGGRNHRMYLAKDYIKLISTHGIEAVEHKYEIEWSINNQDSFSTISEYEYNGEIKEDGKIELREFKSNYKYTFKLAE